MKKIIFLILIVVGISYGQSGNPIVDSLTAHRTDINLNATNHDTLATDVQTNTTNVALKSNIASPTFTGTVTIPTLNITSAFQIDEAPLTANISELNILDGVTSTTSELNILDGVTATATELNYVDGVTSNIQTQINAITTAQGDAIVDSIQAQYQYRNFVISYPYTNMENIPLKVGQSTMVGLEAVIQGGTSVIFMIKKGSNITSGTDVLSSDITCTSTTTAQDFTSDISGTYDDIASTEYVWLDIGAVTGAVKTITVTMKLIGRD